MKRLKLKRVVAFALVAVLGVFLVSPAGAAARTAVLDVTYGLTLKFNGYDAPLTDVNGKKVEPFVYQGTTYVPIRAVSGLFGASINYDANSQTAYIYNDYAEMCMAVNTVEQIMTDCFILFDDELNQNPDNGFKDYTERVNAVIQEVNAMQQTLQALQRSNSQWTMFSIFVLPQYNSVVSQIRVCEDAYRAMRSNFTASNVQAFGEACLQMTKYFNEGRDAVSLFYAHYAAHQ